MSAVAPSTFNPLAARNLVGGAMRILAQADLDLVHARAEVAAQRVQVAVDLLHAAQLGLPPADEHSRGV